MLTPGIKITCDWRTRPEWKHHFEDGADPMEELKELGIRFVEFEFWRRTADRGEAEHEAELVLEEASKLIQRGLLVHLHPYVHQDERGPGYLSTSSEGAVLWHLEFAVDFATRLAELQGVAPLIVFHAADNLRTESDGMGETRFRSELLSRTQRFFQHADAHIDRTAADVRILCENPPPSSKRIRIGETPGEAVAAVDGTSFDLCWDVGHYLRFADVLAIDKLPPPEFLDRVQHVHVHSVVDGKDHRPATANDPYLRDCVALLAGRDVTATLEYNYGDGNAGDPRSALDYVRQGVEALSVSADGQA